MPAATVQPTRIRYRDLDRDCDVSRVVSYRGKCGCRWYGPSRSSYAEAQADAAAHRHESGHS